MKIEDICKPDEKPTDDYIGKCPCCCSEIRVSIYEVSGAYPYVASANGHNIGCRLQTKGVLGFLRSKIHGELKARVEKQWNVWLETHKRNEFESCF